MATTNDLGYGTIVDATPNTRTELNQVSQARLDRYLAERDQFDAEIADLKATLANREHARWAVNLYVQTEQRVLGVKQGKVMTGSEERFRAEQVIAVTLKRLYPQNPDVVLGREARIITGALIEAGIVLTIEDPAS